MHMTAMITQSLLRLLLLQDVVFRLTGKHFPIFQVLVVKALLDSVFHVILMKVKSKPKSTNVIDSTLPYDRDLKQNLSASF